jgi:hypothetical protein
VSINGNGKVAPAPLRVILLCANALADIANDAIEAKSMPATNNTKNCFRPTLFMINERFEC